MTLSMHQASIPALVKSLTALSAIIDKAVAHCDAAKIKPEVLIAYRLHPSMLPLSAQVQIASDMAKNFASRVSGTEVPKFPDTETTFNELKARIAKTIAHLNSFTPAQIDGTENKEVSFKVGHDERTFKGAGYLSTWVLPNFYFHVTTAYAILRHCGVPIGKGYFLGAV